MINNYPKFTILFSIFVFGFLFLVLPNIAEAAFPMGCIHWGPSCCWWGGSWSSGGGSNERLGVIEAPKCLSDPGSTPRVTYCANTNNSCGGDAFTWLDSSNVWEGKTCTAMDQCCSNFLCLTYDELFLSGKWDIHNHQCVTCNGPFEDKILGDGSNIYFGCGNEDAIPGDGKCEAACGGSFECDGLGPNSPCGSGINMYCDFSCQCVEKTKPDLAVADIQQERLAIKYKIKNNSFLAGAGPSNTYFYVNDVYRTAATAESLGASVTTGYITAPFYISEVCAAGQPCTIRICADGGNSIDEENENNNCSSIDPVFQCAGGDCCDADLRIMAAGSICKIPNINTPADWTSCLDACTKRGDVLKCDGVSPVCSSNNLKDEDWAPVSAGKVCCISGAGGCTLGREVDVSAQNSCASANDCAAGLCAGYKYYQACSLVQIPSPNPNWPFLKTTGVCRSVPTNATNAAFTENIYAENGYTLTSTCEKQGTNQCQPVQPSDRCQDDNGMHNICEMRCSGETNDNNAHKCIVKVNCTDHCTNRVKDCDETGVDSGGSCPAGCFGTLNAVISGTQNCTVTASLNASCSVGENWLIKDRTAETGCNGNVLTDPYSYTCSSWPVNSGPSDPISYTYDLYIGGEQKDTKTVTCSADLFRFHLTVSPDSGTINQGGAIENISVGLVLEGGTSYTVGNFRLEGFYANSGISAAFNPLSCGPTCETKMRLQVSYDTPAGGYNLQVCGTGHNITSCANYNLMVTSDFSRPVVTTNPATNIGKTNATLNGYLNYDGGDLAKVWFKYGDTEIYTASTSPLLNKNTGASFFAIISELIKGKAYHFRALAQNRAGTAYGLDNKFITKPDPPRNFAATALSDKISLSWNRGGGAVYTMVRKKTGSFPASVDDGEQIYLGEANYLYDTNIRINTAYYYCAWSKASDEGLEVFSDDKTCVSAQTGELTKVAPFNLTIGGLPEVIIDSKPDSCTSVTAASFSFHGTYSATSYKCRVTNRAYSSSPWGDCASPKNYTYGMLYSIYPGANTFEVKAANIFGEGPTAVYKWTIDMYPPKVVSVSAGPSQLNLANPETRIIFEVSDSGGCNLSYAEVWRAVGDIHGPSNAWEKLSTIQAPENSDSWKCQGTNNCIVDSPNDGIWWYGIHVFDKAGNMAAEGHRAMVVADKTKPNTQIKCNEESCKPGWYNNPVLVALDCLDVYPFSLNNSACYVFYCMASPGSSCNFPASGVVGGTRFNLYSSKNITFYSKDWVGNTEPIKSQEIRVDTQVPVSRINSPPVNSSQSADFKINVTDTDEEKGSGIDAGKCYYGAVSNSSSIAPCNYMVFNNFTNWKSRPCNSDFTATIGVETYKDCLKQASANFCCVGVKSQDLVGHTSAIYTRRFMVSGDTVPPVTTIKIFNSAGQDVTAASTWLKQDTYTIKFEDADDPAGFGIKTAWYSIESFGPFCEEATEGDQTITYDCWRTVPGHNSQIRNSNSSLSPIPFGKDSQYFNLEGSKYKVTSMVIDKNNNGVVKYLYLNTDFSPPSGQVK